MKRLVAGLIAAAMSLYGAACAKPVPTPETLNDPQVTAIKELAKTNPKLAAIMAYGADPVRYNPGRNNTASVQFMKGCKPAECPFVAPFDTPDVTYGLAEGLTKKEQTDFKFGGPIVVAGVEYMDSHSESYTCVLNGNQLTAAAITDLPAAVRAAPVSTPDANVTVTSVGLKFDCNHMRRAEPSPSATP